MRCSLCKISILDYQYNWLNGKLCCQRCYETYKPQEIKASPKNTSNSRESLVVLAKFENEVDAAVVRDMLYSKGVVAEIRGHTNTAIAPNGSEYAVNVMQLLVPQRQIHYCKELIHNENIQLNGVVPVTLLIKKDYSYLWMIFFMAVVLPLGLWIYPYPISPLTSLLVFALMPLFGMIIGKKRAVYICTNHRCNERNTPKATRCKKCSREIKGVVSSRAEITAFQEKQKTVKT